MEFGDISQLSQHLILLGGNEETVIETGFKAIDNKKHA